MAIDKPSPHNHSPLEGESASQERSSQVSRWGEIKRRYTQQAQKYAQTLRKQPTNTEGLLWYYLRNRRLGGYKFRRQQPIGRYIVDFVCLSHQLIVELDGGQHADNLSYDQQRDAYLQQQNFRILRFWNDQLLQNSFVVLETIFTALESNYPPPTDAPAGSALVASTPPRGGSD